jgi:site-specific DNA-methyltransferase (adenine-specific)
VVLLHPLTPPVGAREDDAVTELPTEAEPVRVVEGDCLDVLARLDVSAVAAVVSDPPWGIAADTDYTRFSKGSGSRDYGPGIEGDADPFDPTPWLAFPRVALWGAHCFSNRLPVGRWLVWLKKRDSKLGAFMSDAELC